MFLLAIKLTSVILQGSHIYAQCFCPFRWSYMEQEPSCPP